MHNFPNGKDLMGLVNIDVISRRMDAAYLLPPWSVKYKTNQTCITFFSYKYIFNIHVKIIVFL